MKISLNKEKESDYVKSLARELLYKYKHIKQIQNIDVDDIYFVRDTTLNKSYAKEVEIISAAPELLSLSSIKFFILIGSNFDNLDITEQKRMLFHALLHIPSNYKEQAENKGSITLRKHDIEMFMEESDYLNDIKTESKEREVADNSYKATRAPLLF